MFTFCDCVYSLVVSVRTLVTKSFTSGVMTLYYSDLQHRFSNSDLQHRFSKDKKLDSRGKDLLEFCISHQIRILNGRVLGDCFGNFTCFTPNGCSTVDYCLAAENLLEKILYFKVNAFNPIISDCHCLLQWKISSDFVIRPENECHTTKLEPKFQWSTDSATKFELALSSPDIKEKPCKVPGTWHW